MTALYVAATTLEEALGALADGARPIAGGTDLVVGARQGKASLPESLVAIHKLQDLGAIEEDGDLLRIGALATHADLCVHPVVTGRLTALADASARVGSHATRAQGTIGGNLMNASPAMEVGGPLMVFDATVALRSQGGERVVAVAELMTGPGETVAEPDELLTGVEIPLPPEGTGSAYARLEYRRHMEIAVVGATAAVTLADGEVERAAVAITALAPTIRLAPAAAEALVGSDGGGEAAKAAARAAAEATDPITDVRASADYRRAMAEVLTRRVIAAAVGRARGEDIGVPASEALFGGAA